MRHIKRKSFNSLIFIILFSLSSGALAAPEVTIRTTVEKEREVIDENGQPHIERVKADSVAPGETIHFTLTYSNSGDEPATSVVLNNPVSADAIYVAGSAWGDNSNILFSIDNGENFKKAANLTYEVNGKTRTAAPERYNAIRWIIGEIPAGGNGMVGFSTVIK